MNYNSGKQPCLHFRPHEISPYSGNAMPHDCYKGCGKTVAFCQHCSRDHHEDGYDTCSKREKDS